MALVIRAQRRPRLVGAVVLILGIGVAQAAFASSPPNWLGRALTLRFGEKGIPGNHPERYQIDTGGGFVFDRGAHGALLKFDDSPEVWVLNGARGPRGDMIFSNDLGQALLRTTKLGGVTVFTPKYPQGSAASLAGASSPIKVGRVEPAQLFQRMLSDSVRASRAAGQPISFQALDADSASSGVIADAGLVASVAIMDLSMASGGRSVLAHLRGVDIVLGRKPGATMSGGVLRVTVAPHEGLPGRPSSASILRALGAELPLQSVVRVSRH